MAVAVGDARFVMPHAIVVVVPAHVFSEVQLVEFYHCPNACRLCATRTMSRAVAASSSDTIMQCGDVCSPNSVPGTGANIANLVGRTSVDGTVQKSRSTPIPGMQHWLRSRTLQCHTGDSAV